MFRGSTLSTPPPTRLRTAQPNVSNPVRPGQEAPPIHPGITPRRAQEEPGLDVGSPLVMGETFDTVKALGTHPALTEKTATTGSVNEYAAGNE